MSNINGLITPSEAKKLNDAYTTRHTLISKDITKTDDNRSSWYSLKELKAYLKHAEEQAEELGFEMNGIRIYCGAHEPEEGCESDAEGLTTLFLVPTTAADEGKGGGGANPDISDADGLNRGGEGKPPGANYPQ
ncbi:hypothetical protein [Winogradskyella endarachnes]|uniref:Uncharacterized protein n=1 Tax=Winogradskyella endarachnes TaxID=2681965 RepID=A0A6L6U7Y7_9FLAO|nr:hypothetical protein [Winogradskyella endarachnes]MUU76944.1 hypothetical protein [Winogradskyella endarachnes]